MKQAPAGDLDASGLRILVLHTEFNAHVVDGLTQGALEALQEMGASPRKLRQERVPGAFELPVCAQAAAETGRYDAIVALGAVIKGHTDHYDHIAREAAAGLAAVARKTGVPVAFGVLTVRKEAHALVRSAPGPENKGREAARAAVATARLLRRLRKKR
jgi:6,7-dimethyl-8-ribityllumazine synthase